jgi:hypothetical protein
MWSEEINEGRRCSFSPRNTSAADNETGFERMRLL